MAQVKLKEEQELWEPAEEDHSVARAVKEEPESTGVQSSDVVIKEEPEEVSIKQESPHIKCKDEMETEESRADTDAEKRPKTEQHSENSSDTDDSEDWAALVERPTPQTQTVGNGAEAKGAEGSSVCGKEYRTGTKSRPFKCTLCEKCFQKKHQLLNSHMKTHTGERPFKCTVCPKDFAQGGTLKRHMSTHTGEKPFRCSLCSKYFTLVNSLKKHMQNIHRELRPFRCSVCAARFEQFTDLKVHEIIHTGQWNVVTF